MEAIRPYVELIAVLFVIAVFAVIAAALWGWRVDLGVALAGIAFVRAARVNK
jgi:hypothetical protein